jgi:tetratricopeptide (TPR) repeat protein
MDMSNFDSRERLHFRRNGRVPIRFQISAASSKKELDIGKNLMISIRRRMPKKFNLRKKLTRQERHDLDLEIEFMEGIVRREPDYVEALQILGDAYTRRGLFADGLKVDERLAALRCDDPIVHYNLACSYSLMKHYDEAICALERALNLGYRDFKWLNQDPDLKNLRKHTLYKRIRAKIQSLRVRIG